ncbi:hypothetical protein [Olleya aquimaris]|uniref:Lipopolysaccharide biosynthesis protein n=1 Tax=Olleya aquimaris TaxID=639310 RepID=A0A327RAM7_9FLAO|nr:hypothetical protein [Olleya aquimaris]RAJ13165.1 hypothetical protein LY08_02064 [Olleya aquimaris]
MKKILIVGPPSLGYLTKIDQQLNQREGVQSHIVLIDKFTFKYRNFRHKIINFLSKAFLGKNLKKEHVNTVIINKINQLGPQDLIFIIRPDLLKPKTLKYLKTQTKSLQAFYYDSTRRFPEKVDIIPLFDKVYSYDRLDVEKYNLEFLTNYIFDESENTTHEQLFFNISTHDYRYEAMERLAKYIHEKQWSKEILVLGPDDLTSEYLTIIHQQIPVDEVAKKINKSKIIIEIQRKEQVGLSFRIFEALGHRKKLITTNADVVNYDFYHPQNILVIDEDNINIPEDFVTSPYIPVKDDILNQYRLNYWINKVFDLQ